MAAGEFLFIFYFLFFIFYFYFIFLLLKVSCGKKIPTGGSSGDQPGPQTNKPLALSQQQKLLYTTQDSSGAYVVSTT
jgi:hypothetical protein